MAAEVQECEAHLDPPGSKEWWIDLTVVLFCVCFSGLMSGLTVGLASIDRLSLEIDAAGDPAVRSMSVRIFRVIDHHHWMLCTLLLCNAGALESLPLYLDKMVPEVVAIVLSVTAVLIFGEILPMSFCTGPAQITIAYYLAPVVYMFMVITCPITWPFGKLLDWILGEHLV